MAQVKRKKKFKRYNAKYKIIIYDVSAKTGNLSKMEVFAVLLQFCTIAFFDVNRNKNGYFVSLYF